MDMLGETVSAKYLKHTIGKRLGHPNSLDSDWLYGISYDFLLLPPLSSLERSQATSLDSNQFFSLKNIVLSPTMIPL